MKGIAIGLSNTSKVILKRLKKTEFIDEIYIASSSYEKKYQENIIPSIKPKEVFQEKWKDLDLIIFIGSIGASIRLINSFLTYKDQDPGVIVIDNKCTKIVPLIGLHQSNTQNIAYQIANLLGGEIIETNNFNNQSLLNLDAFGNQWGWKRSGNVNDWSKLVIKQAKNEEIFCKQISGNSLWKTSKSAESINHIDKKDTENSDSTFHVSIFENHETSWHPPVLWVGIGCERNTSKELITNSLNNFLESGNLSQQSIAGFATIDIKKDEKGILELAKEKNLPIKFFSKEDLTKIIVPNPSNVVQNEIGTPSVAEASCLLAAGEESKLLQEKRIFKNQSGAVTIAVAESKNQYNPTHGEIHIIGSGPGDISFLTNNARKALSRCTVWIGYKMYLDLIKPLKRSDQVLIESKLTEEKDRCSKAIKLAEEGIKVALISSGESGFYGMAGLLLELIQKIKKEYRPYFEIHPGISSVQLAAAISGAPLMNDFCSISLSDKLTPWSLIEKRIEGALLGDFVITLFNPQSVERNWQLKSAIDLCLKTRHGDTPVLIARQVGRENQSRRFCTLNNIPFKEIDMLSIIIIGNSQTTLVDEIFLTPRGYLQNQL
ncbi:Cobalamin biosynthesis protein CbiG [Prochlorococcus marinus str. MIT 9321]|uniref:Cobalamin biosynthesis protein CbiG n=1 Tax=Prochlorococcus marinus str. MIT 9401 TaxID=167551 RepID=A0A0A2B837_PROMR|nr:precorrin-3B C(17)-methyltransferase [Prochlorococcus marinus]KGG03097.1 Cobalamin biosynthesis protein CbiG [Prochlorococcus marinus str. MIT 9321]KGG06597.1 Cobalamin biosynthesis protein CbiG [Prochlorococcus marinus str. MIT 9322]KGG10223.1 Cobalamin biosynthesis protein CbiG [Prochlorococcus marinus str. MIT 9401]